MTLWVEEFPGNFVWSNAALVTKGMAPYGADGSTYHAQADNRQVGVDYIADWITDNVVRTEPRKRP